MDEKVLYHRAQVNPGKVWSSHPDGDDSERRERRRSCRHLGRKRRLPTVAVGNSTSSHFEVRAHPYIHRAPSLVGDKEWLIAGNQGWARLQN
jgi:hypothetical protein